MSGQNNLGIIEGFFGRVWDWETRYHYAEFLKENQYEFYIYAPKADQCLRSRWQDDWPQEEWEALQKFGDVYSQAGLSWGVGLSPYEIYLNYDQEAIAAIEKKVRYLNKLDLNIIAVLFDDMRGDADELSQIQVDVVHRIADLSTAESVIMCPTYYTDDPILEKLFGKKPEGYLQSLGKQLDSKIDVFWTGEKVCSTEYPASHLKDVGDRLGRKPFIWDNYPVNDGAKLSLYLFLRAFENRHEMGNLVSGHAVNPMNQPYLSKIPLKTLPVSYEQQENYDPAIAFREAVISTCPENLSNALINDIGAFQDQGLGELSDSDKEKLIGKYLSFPEPAAQEVVQWLQGEFEFDPACLTG